MANVNTWGLRYYPSGAYTGFQAPSNRSESDYSMYEKRPPPRRPPGYYRKWICCIMAIIASLVIIATIVAVNEFHPFISDEEPCDSDPCLNGGTCTDDDDEYECECTPDWTGANCETEVEETTTGAQVVTTTTTSTTRTSTATRGTSTAEPEATETQRTSTASETVATTETTATEEQTTTTVMTSTVTTGECPDPFVIDEYTGEPTEIPFGWEVFFPGAVYGAARHSAGDASGDDCLDDCEADSSCCGIDYDMENGICRHHTDIDMSDELITTIPYSIHVKKSNCGTLLGDPTPFCSGTVTQAPATMTVPVTTAAATAGTTPDYNYCADADNNLSGDPDEPSNIPPDYEVYWPGFVAGGNSISTGQNGDVCLTNCLIDNDCEALTYDLVNEECFIHTSSTSCDTIDTTDDNYIHIKRDTTSCPGNTVEPSCIGHPTN